MRRGESMCKDSERMRSVLVVGNFTLQWNLSCTQVEIGKLLATLITLVLRYFFALFTNSYTMEVNLELLFIGCKFVSWACN